MVHLVGWRCFAGKGQPSSLTIFLVTNCPSHHQRTLPPTSSLMLSSKLYFVGGAVTPATTALAPALLPQPHSGADALSVVLVQSFWVLLLSLLKRFVQEVVSTMFCSFRYLVLNDFYNKLLARRAVGWQWKIVNTTLVKACTISEHC